MDFVNLGASGLKVSRLALGLAFRNQTDPAVMEQTIRRGIELGINFFDSANDYGRTPERPYGGPSEEALGRAIAGCRDDVVITSKVYWNLGPHERNIGSSRYHILREVERSLRRLNTDHLDVYLLHQRDRETPWEETIGVMADLVRQGKTRYWGVCNHTAWEAAMALGIAESIGAPAPVTVQNGYSLLDRSLETNLLPFCRETGRGLMAISPMGVGLLTGTYRPGQPPPPGSPWAERGRDEFDRALDEGGAKVLEAVLDIAGARDLPPAHVALNWVMAQPGVSVTIMGCDTPDLVDENIGAVDWSLTAEEEARLTQVSSRRPAAPAI